MFKYACLVLGFLIVDIVLYTTFALYKIAQNNEMSGNGIYNYVIHWTNWSWTYIIIFFASITGFHVSPGPRSSCCNVECASLVVAWAFFPLNAIVWFVFVAVQIMLLQDSTFITDLFATIMPGIVMVANDVYHAVPVGTLLLFVAIFPALICLGVNRVCTTYERGTPKYNALCIGYALWSLFIGTWALFTVYLLVLAALETTIQNVYSPSLQYWQPYVGLLVVGLIVNGLPLGVMLWCFSINVASNVPLYDRYRAMLKTDEEIFGPRLGTVRSAEESNVTITEAARLELHSLVRDVDPPTVVVDTQPSTLRRRPSAVYQFHV